LPELDYLRFAISSTIAGLLTLDIAFITDLPRPWWAMMAAFVTTQPMAGNLRPKMTYRVVGVLLGAVVAVTLIPRLINWPPLMSAAFALWVAICLFFSVLDRTPRAFMFMLAGYTAAIIGFPYIDQPGDIFAIAVARVEEMILGIGCATVVHSLLRPWSAVTVLNMRTGAFLKDAGAWIADALRGLHNFREDRERHRFASDISELGILSSHLAPDTLGIEATRRMAGALQDRMSILLPLASAAEDRLDVLKERAALSEPVQALIADIVAWLSDQRMRERISANELMARCRALSPDLSGAPDWDTLLTASLCERLSDFLEAYDDCRELALHLEAPTQETFGRVKDLLARRRRSLHRDYPLAILTGLAAGMSVILYCSIWIAIAWPEGAATAAFAAIVSCSFVAQDDPAPVIGKYLAYTAAALPISAIYLFLILPMVDGAVMLSVVLVPVLMVMSYVQAIPSRAARALPMLACFIVAMGFLDRYTADFARFLNVAFAQMGGVVVTIGPARLFRAVAANRAARRLLRLCWRDLATMAALRHPLDEIAWSNRMLDRIALLTPRLALAGPAEPLAASDALRDLRIGRNIVHLQRARVAARPDLAAPPIEQVLAGLEALFRDRVAHGAAAPPPHSLLTAVDHALSALAEVPASPPRRAAMLALTGIRRNLFAHALPYSPEAIR
jgi:uncharacterized membrane protein YccC